LLKNAKQDVTYTYPQGRITLTWL